MRFSSHGCVRVAEPHDYGVRRGVEQLLVYQLRGQSRSGRLPNWRFIVVSEMADIEVLDDRFPGGREAPSGEHARWDQLYLRVAPRD